MALGQSDHFEVKQRGAVCHLKKASLSYSRSACVAVSLQKGGLMTDRRRYRVVETKRINAETYHLVIDGQLWSEVEWSPSRQRWCIQDAAGHCLTHVEHIVGEDRDVQTAIRLAKRMIVDGRMPMPEEAYRQLDAKLKGEPIPFNMHAEKIPTGR